MTLEEALRQRGMSPTAPTFGAPSRPSSQASREAAAAKQERATLAANDREAERMVKQAEAAQRRLDNETRAQAYQDRGIDYTKDAAGRALPIDSERNRAAGVTAGRLRADGMADDSSFDEGRIMAMQPKPVESPEVVALRQTKTRLGEVVKFQKTRVKEFDSTLGSGLGYDAKLKSETGPLSSLEQMEARAAATVGTIKGAFTPGVSAGDPTEDAIKARTELDDLVKQAQSSGAEVRNVEELKAHRESLRQQRQRIAEDVSKAEAALRQAELAYGSQLAARYGYDGTTTPAGLLKARAAMKQAAAAGDAEATRAIVEKTTEGFAELDPSAQKRVQKFEPGFWGRVGDLALSVAKGGQNILEGLDTLVADVLGTGIRPFQSAADLGGAVAGAAVNAAEGRANVADDILSVRPGEGRSTALADMQSEDLKRRRAESQAAIRAAGAGKTGFEKFAAEFGTAFREGITDPVQFSNTLAEQVPMLIPSAVAARVASKLAPAAKAAQAAKWASIGTAAAMQGADVADDVKAEIGQVLAGMSAEDAAKVPGIATYLADGDTLEKAKAQFLVDEARKAFALGAGASAAVNALPGNVEDLIGRMAAGQVREGAKGGVKGAIAGAAKAAVVEPLTEIPEEVAGRVAVNRGVRQVDPSRRLDEGLGETAAKAALSAVGTGAVVGAADGSRRGTPPAQEQPAPTATPPPLPEQPEPAAEDGTDPFSPELDPELSAELAQSTARMEEGQTAPTEPAPATPAPTSSPTPVAPAPEPNLAPDNREPETPTPSGVENILQVPPEGASAVPVVNSEAQKPEAAGSTPAPANITPEPVETKEAETQGVAGAVSLRSDTAPAPVSTPEKLEGEKISREWTTFSPESGSLAIPRAEMPQVKAEARGALTNFLKARGITSEQSEVLPGTLKPTQAEYSQAKVNKARKFEGGDRAILVSSDNHVVDGHHQWMAKLTDKPSEPMRVIRLSAPIREVLSRVAEFPSVGNAGGATNSPPPAATSDQPQETPKPTPAPAPEGGKPSTEDRMAFLQLANSSIGNTVFRDIVPQSVQNDGQRLLTAIQTGDLETARKIRARYEKEAGRGSGGIGAGPGKVREPRRGVQTVYGVADKFVRDYSNAGTQTTAPIVARGKNKPAEFVKQIVRSTGIKGTDAPARAIIELSNRLHKAAPANFEGMEVHALSEAEWQANPATGSQTPDSAAAYNPETNTLYLRTERVKQPTALVSAIVHESGHFAERFALPEALVAREWAKLDDSQIEQAAADYNENDQRSAEQIRKDPRARSEWVAQQFARVVAGKAKTVPAGIRARLEAFFAAMKEFATKWLGSDFASSPAFDREVLRVMGFDADAKLVSPDENLIRQGPPSETTAEMERYEAEYKARPRKQTGAELQKEYEAQQKRLAKAKPTSAPAPSLPAAGGETALAAVEKTEIAEVKATVSETAAGPVVAPTVAEDKRVARMADRKQLRVQKEFLVEALNEAAKTAPDVLVVSDEGKADLALPLRNEGAQNWKEVADANARTLSAKYGVSYGLYGNPVGAGVLSFADQIALAIRSRHAEHVTVEVPGDGTFRVPNTKADIRRLAERVKKQFGTGIGAIAPRTPPTGARPVAPLAKKVTPEAVEKAVGLSAAEESLTDNKGNRNQRAVLNYTVQDGAFTVASNGRVLTVAVDGKGTPKSEVEKKGYKVPNWRQIMEASKKLIKLGESTISPRGKPRATGDAGEILKVLNRIEGLRDEKKMQSVFVHVVDGKIGLSFLSAKVGDFRSDNVPPGNRAIAAVDPDYLRTVAETARSLGVEKMDLHTEGTAEDWRNPLVFFAGDKAVSIVMPIRAAGEGANIFAPSDSSTLGTPAEGDSDPVPLTDAEKDAARRELAGEDGGRTVLNPPKNAEVPGSGGKQRYRSHTDTLLERGYDAVKRIPYDVLTNAAAKAQAKAFRTAAGDAVAAAEVFNAASQLPGAVRVALGVEIERELAARRHDKRLSEENRAEAAANFTRFSEALAELGTKSGQTSQAFNLVPDIMSEEGALHAATNGVKQRQDQMLGEDGVKAEKEIIDAMNGENAKVIDALLKDVKADVRKVKVTKKMVERTVGELPKNKKELDAAIREAFDEASRRIADILRTHHTKVDAIGARLVDKLTQEAGLSPADAEKLAEAVRTRIAARTDKAKREVLARLSRDKKGVARRVFTLVDRIVEMSNAGALDQPALRTRIAEELKLPRVTDALATRLKELTDKAQRTPEGFQRDRIETDILDELRKVKGIGPIDIATAVYYANILSGYTTQLVNIISTGFNVAAELTNEVGRSEADALLGRNGAKLGRATKQALTGFADGARTGFLQAASILKTGYATKAFDEKLPEVSPILELLAKEEAKGAMKGVKGYAMAARYVTRAMKAADAVFFRSASEAYQRVAAAKLAGALDRGMDRAEANRKIRDMLSISPSDFEAARTQAREEGLTGLDYQLRVAEIVHQKRNPGIVSDASRFAQAATFNSTPRGALGIIARKVGETAQAVPPLKLFVPFTNIVANVTNASLNYSPVGFARAARGFAGEKSMTDAERAKAGIAPLSEERASLAVKATAGTMAMVALLAYGLAGDDDDMPVITATGPKNVDQRNQLRRSGWKPHSVKIGDAYVSYLTSPAAVPLAFVGNIIDGIRYNGLSEKDLVGAMTQASVGIGSTITEMSFLSGVADLFDTLRGAPGASPEKWAGNVATSALVPNLVKQVDRTFDPTLREAKTLGENVASAIPGLRHELPARLTPTGTPIESSPLGRFGGIATGDALWDTLNAKGAVISAVDSAKIDNRAATPAELRLIVQESGPRIEQRLRAALPAIQRMSDEQAAEFVKGVAREERARARQMLPVLVRRSAGPPVFGG